MFKKKRILVYGAGVSGLGVAEVLLEQGASVYIYDAKECILPEKLVLAINEANGKIIWGEGFEHIADNIDVMVLSPGIAQDKPEVLYAKKIGKPVVSEIEIAAILNPGKLIAITGTNGKTTTTTLVGEMLKSLPNKIAVGGNIGQALSKQAQTLTDASDILVAEISSFQLESIDKFKPNICAILNITPDHLDRHKTLECYIKTKARIFENQHDDDFLILNYEDEQLRQLGETADSNIYYFSSERVLEVGAFVNDAGHLIFKDRESTVDFGHKDSLQIFGKHNIENVLAAVIIAYISGVKIEDIKNTLHSFKGVEHRIEFVASVNGVDYYNDSKATNPESTIKALEAFNQKVILLAGGYDKKTDLGLMMQIAKAKTNHLFLFGNAKERFAENALKYDVQNITIAASFEDAVNFASKIATKGDIVLLSPACSSYDRFKNYEQRGQYFKELVRNLLKK